MKSTHIKIVSSGKYVPNKILTNDDLEKMVDTSDAWITSRTGIKERRISEKDEYASDMAYLAAKRAIEKNGCDVNSIDLIIVASITGKQMTPSVANRVQKKLGITSCMSFDVNAACTGFIYALEVASSLLETSPYKKALVIGAEKLSSVLDYQDRNTCILFGDGAGAVLVEKDEKYQSYFYNQAKADETDALTVKNYIKMDGRKVFLFAVDAIKKSILEIIKHAHMKLEDIDRFVPHQANLRIIQSVSKSMGIDIDKFVINLDKYGNTSAASIPIALDEYLEKGMKDKYIILVGFGGGFTWGSALLQLQ